MVAYMRVSDMRMMTNRRHCLNIDARYRLCQLVGQQARRRRYPIYSHCVRFRQVSERQPVNQSVHNLWSAAGLVQVVQQNPDILRISELIQNLQRRNNRDHIQ